MRRRKILFTTGIRSDFYIQSPVMEAVDKDRRLECLLIVTGAHLSPRFGRTVDEVKEKGYKIVAEIDSLIVSDRISSRPQGAAVQLQKMIKVFERTRPDIVIAPYDREEAITVALAGVYMNIPVAHLGAGDRTRVNVDGIVRHGVTKLSHILFASTRQNAERLVRMGEERWRIFNVGHAGLDRYRNTPSMNRQKVGKFLEMDIDGRPLIVMIQHPVSSETAESRKQILATLSAIDELGYPAVIIHPNSDPGRNEMVAAVRGYKYNNMNVRKYSNIPEEYFINIVRHADVLVGNSSMGVLEAPMLKLAVVNVGNRQKDRQHAANMVFVPHDRVAIMKAVRKCLFDRNFRKRLGRCPSPYGDGRTGPKISDVLAGIYIDGKLLNKKMTY